MLSILRVASKNLRLNKSPSIPPPVSYARYSSSAIVAIAPSLTQLSLERPLFEERAFHTEIYKLTDFILIEDLKNFAIKYISSFIPGLYSAR